MKIFDQPSLLLLCVIGLYGCAPLPAKSPPRPTITQPEFKRTLAAARNDPAFDQAIALPHKWWTIFNDKMLDDLVEMAIHDNPNLVTAQARIDEARQVTRLVELESGLRYSSDAALVRQHLSQNGLFPPPIGGSTLNEGDISVGAAYALDWWGKNRALLQASVGERKSAEAERVAAELALAGEVADTYFNWQDIFDRLKLAQQTVGKRLNALHLSASRLKHGIDSAQASSRAGVLLAQAQNDLKQLETQSHILRNRLAALTGNGPDWGDKLNTPLPVSSRVAIPLAQKLPLDWLAQRPDLIALKWQVEVAASRIDGAKADFYPNVDIRLLLGLQSITLDNWLSTKSVYGSFGPAVHIPWFNSGTLRSKLSLQEAEYAATVARYNQALITAANQVADTLTLVSSLDNQINVQHTATLDAERTQLLQTDRYENGLSDRLPVLEEEIAALAQHAQESKLQAERKRAMTALFMALGGGYEARQE